ncbi:MAG: hypothetical protein HQL97_01135 [Magnetococcales bacterium]|nr:hypothetical protein [Magnetococcales bacterium]
MNIVWPPQEKDEEGRFMNWTCMLEEASIETEDGEIEQGPCIADCSDFDKSERCQYAEFIPGAHR